MKQALRVRNFVDELGNPAGGQISGVGISINWQDGPLGRGENRVAPTGAFVEGVIAAAYSRLAFYQEALGGKFKCQANADAMAWLEKALDALEARTAEREARAVEGTHQA